MKNLTMFFLSFIAVFFSSIALWLQCEIPLMVIIFMLSLIFFIIFLIFRVNTVTTKNYVSLLKFLKDQQNQIDILQKHMSKLVEMLKEIESNKKEKFELHEGMIKNLQEQIDNIQEQIDVICFLFVK